MGHRFGSAWDPCCPPGCSPLPLIITVTRGCPLHGQQKCPSATAPSGDREDVCPPPLVEGLWHLQKLTQSSCCLPCAHAICRSHSMSPMGADWLWQTAAANGTVSVVDSADPEGYSAWTCLSSVLCSDIRASWAEGPPWRMRGLVGRGPLKGQARPGLMHPLRNCQGVLFSRERGVYCPPGKSQNGLVCLVPVLSTLFWECNWI